MPASASRAQRRLEMLELLRRIVHEVNASTTLEEALNLIVERVKSVLHADVCSVYLIDPQHGDYVLAATDGLRRSAVGKVRLPADTGLIGLVASRAEPVNLENAQEHTSFHFIASTGEAPFHGFLGVPIVRRRKCLGVLVAQQRLERRFTADEESFLATLGAQLAASLSQAEVRQSLDNLDSDRFGGSLFLEGVASARGLGIGEAVLLFPEANLDSVPDQVPDDIEAECERFRRAVDIEMDELRNLSERIGRMLSEGERALFDAYAMLLSGDSLVKGTLERIVAGNWAPGALRGTIHEYANAFEEMEDPYLQGRAADIRDLGQRLFYRLQSGHRRKREYPERTILVGEEISVTQFLEVDPVRLAGLVSARGTGASHVALLARGLGIPAVFGLNDAPLNRLNGREVVVDGYTARVFIQPNAALRQEFVRLSEEENELSKGLQELRDQPSVTLDGHHLPLLTNSGLAADIAAARDSGAEGVGLYRSELHFFLRERFPSEDEQMRIYRRVLRTMTPQIVILRTLDVGGDKPLSYFPIEEENPFLGWRGVRICLDQPDIFKTQLRAMLRASMGMNNMSIMFPMISTLSELDEVREYLLQAHSELLEDGLNVAFPRTGLMIEVPSAVYLIRKFASRVDFVSIGSNDLVQYLLAVDRNNARVARLYDGLHPAVLRAITEVVDGAHDCGRSVSICGELAGDPAAALALLGTGVDSLSMSLGNLLKVKWVVRSFARTEAERLLDRALEMDDAQPVRALMNRELESRGLGGLIRAGK